jgi:vacuolar-type H+-ATPase subunit H
MKDDLKELESMVNDAGETPQAKVKPTDTGYDLVEQSLPDSDHKVLGRWVQRYKLSDDDPMFGAYLAAKVSFNSAAAAGKALDTLQVSIDKIPDKIFQGSISAAKDINLAFKTEFGRYGQTLVTTVDQSRDKAIGEINKEIVASTGKAVSQIQSAGNNVKVASQTLENMLNGVIEQKAKQGLTEWADAARVAGQHAAQAASHEIYNKAIIIMGGALLLAGLAGGGITYFLTAGKMAPLPIYHTSHGHSLCFETKGNGYCELSGTKQQLSKLRYDPPSNL